MDNSITSGIGQDLLDYRARRCITQKAAAEIIGVQRRHVSAIEKGREVPALCEKKVKDFLSSYGYRQNYQQKAPINQLTEDKPVDIGDLKEIKSVRRMAGGRMGAHGWALTTTALCPDGKRRHVRIIYPVCWRKWKWAWVL